MSRIDAIASGYQIKASYHQFAIPDNRLTGLVESAVQTVTVGTDSKALHLGIRRNANDGVGAKIGDVKVAVLVHNHTVCADKHTGCLCPNGVGCCGTVSTDGYAMHCPVTKVADEQVSVAVKFDTVGTILVAEIFGNKGSENIWVIQRVGDSMFSSSKAKR